MPQMMPMSWMTMYGYFLIVMILFMVKVYFYHFKIKMIKSKKNYHKKENNWMW
uniref:ATP synthase F0 subunit 8 n=1 Tax=Marmessoidea bispina TaxID=2878957 RepID=UPI0025A98B3A|nr:ATP synthase F0 subunit 8 [Marmessoidea bispina]WID87071.1 ATP synthase F0 subunit 8 [Marmessoidea bispina]